MKNGRLNLLCGKGFNMKIIDAHTHIDYITPDFQSDVVGCICCTTNEAEWGDLADLVCRDNRVYGAFGVHPWFVSSVVDGFDTRLENLLKANPQYMVGEIGLDKYKPDIEKQIDVFVKQFDTAIKLKRIVFLHCVGAWDKILHILKQYKDLPIIVAHDFNGNNDIVQNLLRYENVYFSFGKNALYGKNSRIEQIPLDKILFESDGKKDILLKDIVEQISKIKNEKDISEIIYNNTKRILENEQIE